MQNSLKAFQNIIEYAKINLIIYKEKIMKEIICQSENAAQYIKSIILKYAPYVDSRYELFDMGSQQPIIITNITFTDDKSYISFCRGTGGCWSSTDDKATIEKPIDFEEIKSVIDFLLEDYRFIRNIMFHKDTGYGSSIELNLNINWTNESIKKGINCGNIILELTFANDKLRKQYTNQLLQQYQKELSETPTVKKIKDDYIVNARKSEILDFLSKLDEQELKKLMCRLDNDTFMKYSIIGEQNTDEAKRIKLEIPLKQKTIKR